MNKEDVGLYRDDGLGVFKNISRPEIERKEKATFGLDKNIYKPHQKPNNSLIYI